MATSRLSVSFEDMPRYEQHGTLARIMRLAGVPSTGRISHVVQVERIHETPEAGILMVPADTQVVLTERHLTDEGRVGRITRIINTDRYATHFELHMQLRGWMMAQTYVTDFGPMHCEGNRASRCEFNDYTLVTDDQWHDDKYVPWVAERLVPNMPVSSWKNGFVRGWS